MGRRLALIDMRLRCVSWPELTSAYDGPAAFGVLSWTGVTACTRSEDGCLAGFKAFKGYGKYEPET